MTDPKHLIGRLEAVANFQLKAPLCAEPNISSW